MRLIPRKLFLTRGAGTHREKLTSFEMALREAGIAHFNLVRVSSIFSFEMPEVGDVSMVTFNLRPLSVACFERTLV